MRDKDKVNESLIDSESIKHLRISKGVINYELNQFHLIINIFDDSPEMHSPDVVLNLHLQDTFCFDMYRRVRIASGSV